MDSMATAEDRLDELMRLSEAERTRIAVALLDSLGGLDPYAEFSPEQFRTEMARRAEDALEGPSDEMDWEAARARILQSSK